MDSTKKTKPVAKVTGGYEFEAEGKRTGVRTALSKLPKPGEFENLDQLFDGARSPDPADVAAGEKTVEVEEKATGLVPEPSPRPIPVKEPRLSLPGGSTGNKNGTIEESKAYIKARLQKMTISPSDMSLVSTAPPTPQPPLVTNQETPIVSQENTINSPTINAEAQSVKHTKQSKRSDSGNQQVAHLDPLSDVEDDELVPPPPPPEDVPVESSQEHDDNDFPPPDDDIDETGDHHDQESFSNSPVVAADASDNDAEENNENLNVKGSAQKGEIKAASTPQNQVLPTPAGGSKTNSGKRSHKRDRPMESAGKEPEEVEISKESPAAQGSVAQPKSALKTPKNDHTPPDNFRGAVDDDEDKEGEGFNMVHDPETPESVREERIQKEEEDIEMTQNRKKKGTKKQPPSLQEDVSESESETPAKPRRTKKKVRIKASPRGYPAGPRGYSVVPVDDLIEDNEVEGLRRSKRARTEPLQFWRNERPVYGANDEEGMLGEAMGNMPVVKSVLKACETPYKKRKVPQTKKNGNAKGAKARPGRDDDESERIFDARKLKRKYEFVDGEHAMVWNDAARSAVNEKVVSFSKDLPRHDLPLPATRKKSDGKVVGQAAQAFNILNESLSDNYVGYIMGHLTLPPKGIKDYESVGLCAQTFTVCHGQPGALEVSIADPEDEDESNYGEGAQRFLLGPGDMFRIPQNNTYQLQNHSKTLDCMLTWTIIRPHSSN